MPKNNPLECKLCNKIFRTHFRMMKHNISKTHLDNINNITIEPFEILENKTHNSNEADPFLNKNDIDKLKNMDIGDGFAITYKNENVVKCEYEYENTFVESAVKAGGIGVTQTKKTKKIGVSNLKDLVEEEKLLIPDAETITELSYFEENGTSYAAKDGKHDDLVMCLVMFAWFVSTQAFGDYSETDLRDMIFEQRLLDMNEELLDYGFLSTAQAVSDNAEYEKLKEEALAWSKFES